ncbi:MAG: hypothetical protein SFX18_14340 [Pirellulales bacterium]|nr:hypothetical protein [Pirellulales bacterium]
MPCKIQTKTRRSVATYDYRDESGKLLFQVVRYDPKGFNQRKPKTGGGWDWSVKGVRVVPYRLTELPADPTQTVYICEGEKDADNLAKIGIVATCNAGGAGKWTPQHAEYLRGRRVIVLPDNDDAGRKHAKLVCHSLHGLADTVRIVELPGLPPKGDVTDWLNSGGTKADLERLADAAPVWVPTEQTAKLDDAKAPVELDAPDNSDDKSGKKSGPSTAEQLVQLALAHYRFGVSTADELFAVDHAGGPALLLRGNSESLRQRLAKLFRATHERTPNASALADALCVLGGEASDAEPEQLHLRLAKHGDGIVIDLGDKSGRAVEVTAAGWQVLTKSPVLFRRSALTKALPPPERGGSLDDLREVLNVTAVDWPIVIGWLVAALVPNIPHPILLLTGIQGTGKSSAARVLLSLFDPSYAPLRSEPRDMEAWQIQAGGSWGVVIDNLSKIHPWLSDSLCKAVTGDGLIRRILYTDGDLAVSSFRRVICLTSIDAGALRGDLGERLLLVELDVIPDHARRTEQELDSLVEEMQPRLFGAVLDALSQVLAALPGVNLARLPRMADFAKVLAAADKAGVTLGAFDRFMGLQDRIANEVLDGDPFATAILDGIRPGTSWTGTASELLSALWPNTSKPPEGWPSPRGVTGRLRRLFPSLATQGLRVTVARENTVQRRRLLTLTRDVGQNIVQCVQSSNVRVGCAEFLDDKLDDLGRSGENIVQSFEPANNRLLDDLDDKKHTLSGGIHDDDFVPVDPVLGF